jgi:hypothetical protein
LFFHIFPVPLSPPAPVKAQLVAGGAESAACRRVSWGGGSSALSHSGEAAAPAPPIRTLQPSYEWQPVAAWQTVPPGMEVQLPLDPAAPTTTDDDNTVPASGATAAQKVARIPPRWQLQLYVEPDVGFLRTDVTAATTLAELRAAAARTARAEALRRTDKAGERLNRLAGWLAGWQHAQTRTRALCPCPRPCLPLRVSVEHRSPRTARCCRRHHVCCCSGSLSGGVGLRSGVCCGGCAATASQPKLVGWPPARRRGVRMCYRGYRRGRRAAAPGEWR